MILILIFGEVLGLYGYVYWRRERMRRGPRNKPSSRFFDVIMLT
jgi:hypothetical protein